MDRNEEEVEFLATNSVSPKRFSCVCQTAPYCVLPYLFRYRSTITPTKPKWHFLVMRERIQDIWQVHFEGTNFPKTAWLWIICWSESQVPFGLNPSPQNVCLVVTLTSILITRPPTHTHKVRHPFRGDAWFWLVTNDRHQLLPKMPCTGEGVSANGSKHLTGQRSKSPLTQRGVFSFARGTSQLWPRWGGGVPCLEGIHFHNMASEMERLRTCGMGPGIIYGVLENVWLLKTCLFHLIISGCNWSTRIVCRNLRPGNVFSVRLLHRSCECSSAGNVSFPMFSHPVVMLVSNPVFSHPVVMLVFFDTFTTNVCFLLQVIETFVNDSYVKQHDSRLSDGQVTNVWSLIVSIWAVGGMIGGVFGGVVTNLLGR